MRELNFYEINNVYGSKSEIENGWNSMLSSIPLTALGGTIIGGVIGFIIDNTVTIDGMFGPPLECTLYIGSIGLALGLTLGALYVIGNFTYDYFS